MVCVPQVVEIVFVDRPTEVVREVEKRVEVPVEVVKTVTVVKCVPSSSGAPAPSSSSLFQPKAVHDRCPPPPVCCEGKG